ncbi:FG-GAP repeat domain-containing protein [Aeromicrobium wangtongii]|uniref:FG-GAP repeat domain-containing protein n=1 Tax=Aeromicrobium wangtongii TaxID=2969247 RepID=UPI002016F2F5|nr:VCBS repeat-containing protein [Aeromicrobium wangtongii]MCL3817285.1 VCBS repeat-containing protein [Aeromicrobium wangtongii]
MPRVPSALAALVVGSSAALVLATVVAAQAAAPTDPATPASFSRIDVDTKLTGAAFSVSGDVFGTGKQDLVVTAFGAFTGSGQTSTPPAAGTVQIYRPGATLKRWTKVPVVTEADGITFPNQPTLADVNGDGATDVIVPGGYFFDTYSPAPQVPPKNRGSITWWENKGEGKAFVRHDVVTASPFSYHAVQLADLDGDGIKDMVTTGEQGKSPQSPADDIVELQYLKGRLDGATGARTFDAPAALGANGGSLPVVSDVDRDGKPDIVSAQYFGAGQPSYLWFKQSGTPTGGALTADNFTMHAISSEQGPGFQIKLVPNLRGDGIDRWVGTNHLSYPLTAPEGGVFELTPTAAITEPWTSTRLAGPFSPRPTFGQAAPGVFGSGDLDGDGDVDLALSGDGDRRLFWVEQTGTNGFVTHVLEDYDGTTTSVPGMGQAGGAVVADLDGNGTNEMAFSSFDQNTVAVYVRSGGGPAAPVPAPAPVLSVSAPATVTAGAPTTLSASLSAAGASTQPARVTFTAARTGAVTQVGAMALAPGATAGTFTGSIRVRASESGTFAVAAGGATASAAVTVRTTIKGFSTATKRLKKKATIKDTISVRPGFGRTVHLQRWTCSSAAPSCRWKTVSSHRLNGKNRATVAIKAPKGTSFWRVSAPGTKAGSAAVTKSRTVKR